MTKDLPVATRAMGDLLGLFTGLIGNATTVAFIRDSSIEIGL